MIYSMLVKSAGKILRSLVQTLEANLLDAESFFRVLQLPPLSSPFHQNLIIVQTPH